MTNVAIEMDVSDVVGTLTRLVGEMDSTMPMAMELASDIVVVEAKQRAPRATNNLATSIQRMPVTGSFSGGDLQGGVTATAPYAGYVEDGTRPHEIRPRTKKALRWPSRGGPGGWAFAKRVMHPGTRPQPFMAPALEAKTREVIAQFENGVKLAVARAAKGRGR